jgi:hypothetical protein
MPDSTLPYGSSSFTYFFAYKPGNINHFLMSIDNTQNASGVTFSVAWYNDGKTHIFQPALDLNYSPVLGSNALVMASYNNATLTRKLTLNTSNTASDTGNSYNLPASNHYIGGYYSGTGLFNGKMYEVLCFSNILTTEQTQFVEGYLTWKWGYNSILGPTHPYYSAAPTLNPYAWAYSMSIIGPTGPGTPTWINRGYILFSATTTPPTTSADAIVNNMSYRKLGDKEWEVSMCYRTGSSAGSAGTGDYLFTLPNSLSFDLTLPIQSSNQVNVGTNAWSLAMYTLPASGLITDGSYGARTNPIIWDSTRFRILTTTIGYSVQCWGSTNYQLNGPAGMNMKFSFTST